MAEPNGLVVVGASAGGVEALRALAGGLPAGLAAAVCVVLHVPRTGISALPPILDRAGPLPAVPARDGAALEAGRVYVAPPNLHMLVAGGRLRLSRGPAENGHRPAVDPLFRSAARAWGRAVIGVVLSGNRDDGADGLATIARHGGAGLVQDPAEALYPSMPVHAARLVPDAVALPAARLGQAVAGLVADLAGPAPVGAGDDARAGAEGATAMDDLTTDEIGEALEGALWMALRSLEEKAELSRRMAASARLRGSSASAERYGEAGDECREAGRVIRGLVERLGALDGGTRVAERS